jgi:D-alanine transaminase
VGRIAYVNGRYVPHGEAAVHVEDRGYQFADGVYEVIAVYRGRLIDEQGHLDRLRRSLSELGIAWPVSEAVLSRLMREMIRRNRIDEKASSICRSRAASPPETTPFRSA